MQFLRDMLKVLYIYLKKNSIDTQLYCDWSLVNQSYCSMTHFNQSYCCMTDVNQLYCHMTDVSQSYCSAIDVNQSYYCILYKQPIRTLYGCWSTNHVSACIFQVNIEVIHIYMYREKVWEREKHMYFEV